MTIIDKSLKWVSFGCLLLLSGFFILAVLISFFEGYWDEAVPVLILFLFMGLIFGAAAFFQIKERKPKLITGCLALVFTIHLITYFTFKWLVYQSEEMAKETEIAIKVPDMSFLELGLFLFPFYVLMIVPFYVNVIRTKSVHFT